MTYCSYCDVFVGYAGAGVVRPPKDKDEDWLKTHCWMCGKSKEEIEAYERNRVGGNNAGQS